MDSFFGACSPELRPSQAMMGRLFVMPSGKVQRYSLDFHGHFPRGGNSQLFWVRGNCIYTLHFTERGQDHLVLGPSCRP